MAKFLTSNELNHELEKLLENAEKQILVISPYIKLHERYMSVLKTKKESYELKITVIFGKNETDRLRSIKVEDFNFLKEFPNIEIRYEPRLHAKYYANESAAILTSMNLYNFSQDNNIEFGVLTKASLLGNLASIVTDESLDSQAAEYFERVINQSELLFQKIPQYEKTNLGFSKKYKYSDTAIDKLSDSFLNKPVASTSKIKQSKESASESQTSIGLITGYCIRTGMPIPFNLLMPMCQNAFESWSKYKDDTYKEKYCHFSGETSNGLTTFKKPILTENYKKAKAVFKFY